LTFIASPLRKYTTALLVHQEAAGRAGYVTVF
jgi:hypothetical protein